MFGFFKKRTYRIDFDKENKLLFISLLSEINKILKESGHSAQANWINKILITVRNEDQEGFKEKVLSNDLLGGSGSVVDVWINDDKKMNELDEHMNAFLKLTIKSGLDHRAVKSRIIRK